MSFKRKRKDALTAFGAVFEKTKSKSLSSFAALYQLQQHWIDWVGPMMAEQTYVRSFENGILTVWVLHPTLAMHLTYLQAEVGEKIKAHYGKPLKMIRTEHKTKLPKVKKQDKKEWAPGALPIQDPRPLEDILKSVREKNKALQTKESK